MRRTNEQKLPVLPLANCGDDEEEGLLGVPVEVRNSGGTSYASPNLKSRNWTMGTKGKRKTGKKMRAKRFFPSFRTASTPKRRAPIAAVCDR
jgi:hypothetical protein